MFKQLIKRGLDSLAQMTRIIGTSISTAIRYELKEGEIKRAILSRFTAEQLNEIARRKGISFTVEDFITGEKRTLKTKDEKVKYLASLLPLETVVEFAKRYKVKYKDLCDELNRFRAKLEEKKAKVRGSSRVPDLISVLKEFEKVLPP